MQQVLIAYYCLLGVVSTIVRGQYEPPVPDFEILKRGFKASIPYEDGIEIFAFHANINKRILSLEAGTFSVEIRKPIDDKLTFWDRTTKLKPGDTIYYWTYIQFLGLGYPTEGLNYTVPDTVSCPQSQTTVNGVQVCRETLIFDEDFNGDEIDHSKWIIEHRIALFSKLDWDSKFNSYENRDEYRFVRESKLFLKPRLAQSDDDVRGVLDLTDGCTGLVDLECRYQQKTLFLLPPAKSARINSKFAFKFGRIEIRAKLPSGAWIFPELLLLPKDNDGNEFQRMLIGYARGNAQLLTTTGEEIGSTKLYGGPIEETMEPARSRNLLSTTASAPLNNDFHVFTLLWKPDQTVLSVDGVTYGEINTNYPFKSKEFYVSLGVGVGGTVDFPDGSSFGGKRKPWGNTERNSIKSFFDSRQEWNGTWKGDAVALQVDSVKIWAL